MIRVCEHGPVYVAIEKVDSFGVFVLRKDQERWLIDFIAGYKVLGSPSRPRFRETCEPQYLGAVEHGGGLSHQIVLRSGQTEGLHVADCATVWDNTRLLAKKGTLAVPLAESERLA